MKQEHAISSLFPQYTTLGNLPKIRRALKHTERTNDDQIDSSLQRKYNEPMKNIRQAPEFFGKLSFHARRILRKSFDVARERKSPQVLPLHLLSAIVLEKNSLGKTLLRQFGITETHIADILGTETVEKPSEILKDEPAFSPETRTIIANAFLLAHRFSYPYVGSEHLVHALAESKDGDIAELLSHRKKSDDTDPVSSETPFSLPKLPGFSRLFEFPLPGFSSDENASDGDMPALNQFGIPLGIDQPLSGFSPRHKEMESILRTLARKTKSNPLLVGDPGVGKTAIVEAIAQLMKEGKAGSSLEGKRILLLDLAAIVAGTSFRGEFEARLKDIIREAKDHPEIILFIDEIHTLVGAGNASGSLDASNILKPALARGEIRCIGATTFTEYKRHIEKDSALERRFQVIRIAEPSPEESLHILRESRAGYEKHHHLTIGDDAIRAAVSLSIRHLHGRFLPDKAFDLLDEASALLRRKERDQETTVNRSELMRAKEKLKGVKQRFLREKNFEEAERIRSEENAIDRQLQLLEEEAEKREKKQKLTLSGELVAEAVSLLSGTPREKIDSSNISRVNTLLSTLSARIVGQETAITLLSRSVMRSFLDIGRVAHRPRGSFLFLGPSGVGKTFTARTLSDVLFEGKKSFIRFDMSEFRERHHMAQMLGSPAGYVGYGEGGTLTEHLRHHPASVVLFDEIEKAHPDILNLLLQILDEGVLTDAEGRQAHFGESFVILTSNIGSASFRNTKALGFSHHNTASPSFDSQKNDVLEELKREIRPELLARIDHTVVFQPLNQDALEEIAARELLRLKSDLDQHHIRFILPKDTARFIAKHSLTEHDGARSVRKTIQKFLEDPLSQLLLSKKRFPETVRATISKDTLHVRT